MPEPKSTSFFPQPHPPPYDLHWLAAALPTGPPSTRISRFTCRKTTPCRAVSSFFLLPSSSSSYSLALWELLTFEREMQSAVLALDMSFSPNTPATATSIPLPLISCRIRSPNLSHFSHIVPFRSRGGRLISWRRSFSSSISVSSSGFSPRLQKFAAMAASVPESAGEAVESVDFIDNLRLGAMFGVWYLLNIYYNIFNKQVLKAFPFPTTVTAFQFACGAVIVSLMWALNFHPRPKINRSQFAAILPLAVAHTMGNILTNVSLGQVAVSFTHTIKAMEPFFTVLLSALFLAERPTFWVVLSLIPVVGGVALASFTEASFNWIGFSSAMASNLTNQSRNIFSKKFMVHKEALDNINLFSVITIISFILLVPSAVLLEGTKFSPSYLQLQLAANQGLKLNARELCIRLLLSGICFHSYQQVSYSILQEISPVTHAVGNSLKRVVVIVSSVIFFQTAVSPLNALGTGIALMGVYLYSRAKRMKPKLKAV